MPNSDVWDAVAQTNGTPGNSFEFLLRIKNAGGATVQTADITNVNPAFTGKTRNRETYGAKGVDSANKYGETLVLTFDIEVVRDVNGAFQPVLQDLVNASKATGAANRRTITAFDALGADYAFLSEFAISVSRSGTGWDDAAFFTVTATQYGKTTWIANPVITGNVPVIAGVSPSPAPIAAGTTVYIQGAGFTGTTGAASVKAAGVNVTSYNVVSDTLITAILPVATAGPSSIQVTSPVGASAVYTGFARG